MVHDEHVSVSFFQFNLKDFEKSFSSWKSEKVLKLKDFYTWRKNEAILSQKCCKKLKIFSPAAGYPKPGVSMLFTVQFVHCFGGNAARRLAKIFRGTNLSVREKAIKKHCTISYDGVCSKTTVWIFAALWSKQIFSRAKPGVTIVTLVDTCHSGGMMGLKKLSNIAWAWIYPSHQTFRTYNVSTKYSKHHFFRADDAYQSFQNQHRKVCGDGSLFVSIVSFVLSFAFRRGFSGLPYSSWLHNNIGKLLTELSLRVGNVKKSSG